MTLKAKAAGTRPRRRILAVQRNSVAEYPAGTAPTPAGVSDGARRRCLAGLGAAALSLAGAATGPLVLLAPRSLGAQSSPSAGGTPRTLLIVGDSLSAEYGLGRGEGWVALMERRLQSTPTGRGWSVVNASISGETTAGGLTRLPPLLQKHQPAVTVLELGGNDALRGLSLAGTDSNLRRMVALAREAGSTPVLFGMMMPPNYGAAYAKQFSDLYRRIADAEKIPLVPFLLDGFGDDLSWFQPDRIHPAAKAQPRMLDTVWPVLEPLLE